jgi:hypothetical protein
MIPDFGDLCLRLAHPDGLDHDDVEGSRQRFGRGARRPRDPAEPLAGGRRADQHAAVGGVELDPGAVPEQRPARALRAGVHREQRDAAPVRPPRGDQG